MILLLQLLEDLGHQHYKDKLWCDMIRCHYRLKLDNTPMYPEIEEILNRDTELAKQFYRFDRGKTIAQLWNNTSDKGVQLNVNNIIRIVNQIGPNDERLKEVLQSATGQLIRKRKTAAGASVLNRLRHWEDIKFFRHRHT